MHFGLRLSCFFFVQSVFDGRCFKRVDRLDLGDFLIVCREWDDI